MAGRAPPKDGTRGPVKAGIMMPQPRIPHDHRNMWRLWDVEPDRLVNRYSRADPTSVEGISLREKKPIRVLAGASCSLAKVETGNQES